MDKREAIEKVNGDDNLKAPEKRRLIEKINTFTGADIDDTQFNTFKGEAIAEAQDAAKNTAAKPEEADYTQIQDSWAELKDVNDTSPADLQTAKQQMQTTAENMVEREKDLNSKDMDMLSAPELEAWLQVSNDSIGDDQDKKERNEKLGQQIDKFYTKYDKENNVTYESSKGAIEFLSDDANTAPFMAFDPFEKDTDGNLIHPEFEETAKFFEQLNVHDASRTLIMGTALEDKKQDMLTASKEDALHRILLKYPEFGQLEPERQHELFRSALEGTLQESTITLLLTQKLEDEKAAAHTAGADLKAEELPAKKREIRKQIMEDISNGSLKLDTAHTVSETSFDAAVLAQKAQTTNLDKRMAQKTDNPNWFQKAKAKLNAWSEKHPKMAAAAKLMGNIGLTVGVNLAAGGTGLAVLGAYRLVKQVNKARREKGSMKNWSAREWVSIAGTAAGAALSAWSGFSGGIEHANGVFGHALGATTRDGIGAGIDTITGSVSDGVSAVGHGFSNAWEAIKHPIDSLSSVGQGAGKISFSNPFNPENGVKFGRAIRTAGVTVATMAVDIADDIKKAKKEGLSFKDKKFWKEIGKSVLKAGAMGGAVFASSIDHHASAEETVSETPGRETNWDMNKTLAENLEANKPEEWQPTMPWSETEHDDVAQPEDSNHAPENQASAGSENNAPENQEETNHAPEYQEDPANIERWNARIDQNLKDTGQAEEIKSHVYELIEKGDVKLPEGIETKEEFLYKMVMKMEQRPSDVWEDLGKGEWNSSNGWERQLAEMDAEKLNTISQDLNDYSDRGVYNGDRVDAHAMSNSHQGNGNHHIEQDNEGEIIAQENPMLEITGKTLDEELSKYIEGDEAAKSEVLQGYHNMMNEGRYDEASDALRVFYDGQDKPFEESDLYLAHRDYQNVLMGNNATHIDDYVAEVPSENVEIKSPNDKQMHDFVKGLKEDFGKGVNKDGSLKDINEAVSAQMAKQVEEGNMTEAEARGAAGRFYKTLDAYEEDTGKTPDAHKAMKAILSATKDDMKEAASHVAENGDVANAAAEAGAQAQITTPSASQMHVLAKNIQNNWGSGMTDDGQGKNFGAVLSQEVIKAVKEGQMTQEEALGATQQFTEAYNASEGNPDKTIKSVMEAAKKAQISDRNNDVWMKNVLQSKANSNG